MSKIFKAIYLKITFSTTPYKYSQFSHFTFLPQLIYLQFTLLSPPVQKHLKAHIQTFDPTKAKKFFKIFQFEKGASVKTESPNRKELRQ